MHYLMTFHKPPMVHAKGWTPWQLYLEQNGYLSQNGHGQQHELIMCVFIVVVMSPGLLFNSLTQGLHKAERPKNPAAAAMGVPPSAKFPAAAAGLVDSPQQMVPNKMQGHGLGAKPQPQGW